VISHDAGPQVGRPLEVVKAAYAAFAARDVPRLLELLADDVTWGEPDNAAIPSAGTHHGHRGVLEWLRIGQATEDILSFEPRRFIGQGDAVAVVGHTRVRARPTGRTYETDFVHLVTVRDGKVASFQEFFDTFVAAEAFRS
jgi:uncharacterized protein